MGTISLAVTGGLTPYTYNWTGGGTDNPLVISAGSFSVTVTDANNCKTIGGAYFVTEPAILTISSAAVTNVKCAGMMTGAIDLTISGGVTPYSFMWNDFIATEDRSGIMANNYAVTVTDMNGCSTVGIYTITQPAGSLILSLNNITHVGCFGNSTGEIDISVIGGTTSYSYLWNDGSTLQDRIAVISGFYLVTVTDANFCTTSGSWAITQPASGLLINTASISHVPCFGLINGAINLAVSGGISPYNYNWSNGASVQDISGVGAATYIVTITDNNGCSISGNYSITQPAALTINSVAISHLMCVGASGGDIDISVSGGTPSYSYLWSNGVSTQDVFDKPAGIYDVTVTDSKFCSVNGSYVITAPAGIVYVDTLTPVEDMFVVSFGGGTGLNSFIKYNIGSIPAGHSIDSVFLKVYVTDKTGTWDGDVKYLNVNNQAWTESDTVKVVWNAIKTDTIIQPFGFGLTTGWSTSPDLSSIIRRDHSVGNTFSTLMLKDPDDMTMMPNMTGFPVNSPDSLMVGNGAMGYSITFNTRHNSVVSLRPKLIIKHSSIFSLTSVINYVSCFGGNNGSILNTLGGGATPYSYIWNTSATTEDLVALNAGSYSLTVTDANSCSTSRSYLIIQPAGLSVSAVNLTHIACSGSTSGAIDIAVGGGTSPYIFLWSNSSSTEDLSGIPAGMYILTVTDNNGCSIVNNYTITQPAAAFTIAASSVTHVLCAGMMTGAVDITVSGGITPYVYLWSDMNTNQDRSALTASTYSVTVTDLNNCLAAGTYIITQPGSSLMITSSSLTHINCFGGGNGAIDITVSGGTPAYSYLWTGALTSEDLSGLAALTYSVTVTDINGCTVSNGYTLTEPATSLTISSFSIIHVDCRNNSTGVLDIEINGGITPYNYLWNDGITMDDRLAIPAGIYTITATDALGCSVSGSYAITQPASMLIISSYSVTHVGCAGGNTGAIDISVFGGTTGYTYLWNTGNTIQDLSAIPAAGYSVTITDAHSCVRTGNFTVTQPASGLSISSLNISHISCNGGSDGRIEISVSGGTPSYSYLWNDGITTEDRINLPASFYSVTITDALSCTFSSSGLLTQPATSVAINAASVTHVNCHGTSTGAVDIMVSGGSTPYAYNWSNSATLQDISVLVAGIYSVTVTDNHACQTSSSYSVTQPAAALIISSANVSHLDCGIPNSGYIGLNISGGTTPYSYMWNSGHTNSNISSLAAGSYIATVTDTKGCQVISSTYTLTQPPMITINAGLSHVNCFGGNNGAINLSILGGTPGFTYSWSDLVTSEDRAALIAGTYNVTVSDIAGCHATGSYTLTQPGASLIISSTALVHIACFGDASGAIDITPSGGVTPYMYAWSPGMTTQDIAGVTAGSFDLTVTDANGCVLTKNYLLTQPAIMNVGSSITHVSCNGGADGVININVSGGTSPYMYLWTGAVTTEDRTGVPAGLYSVSVTDMQGCTVAAGPYLVSEPTVVMVSLSALTHIQCTGNSTGAIDIFYGGGTSPWSVLWSDGSTLGDRNAIPAGSYTITVTDSKACTGSSTYVLTQPASGLIINTASITHAPCNGYMGTISLAVTGGLTPYTYNWTGGGTNNPLIISAGLFSVTVTDNNGCTATGGVYTVTQPLALTISAVAVTHVSCTGSASASVNITVTGGTTGYTYLWSNSFTTQDLINVAAATYTVTVTDMKGCATGGTYAVTEPASLPAVSLDGLTHVSCFGSSTASIDLSASGGTGPYTYNWNDGFTNGDRNNIPAGSYTITITDSKACTGTDTWVITQPVAGVTISTVVLTHVNCNGDASGAINISVTGGITPYSYAWTPAATTQNRSALTAGAYTVTVSDLNSCSTTGSWTITQPAVTLIISSANVSHLDCGIANSGYIDLNISGGTTPYSYIWNSGHTNSIISSLAAGSYIATVTDTKGCQVISSTYTLTQPPMITINAGLSHVNCFGGNTGAINLSILGGTPGFTYSWSDLVTSEDRAALIAGTYNVTVSDIAGCHATGSYTLTQPGASLIISSTALVHIACFGDASGAIDITPSGGVTPYMYAWSPGMTTQDIAGVTAGSFDLTVTDANGCVLTKNYLLTQPGVMNVSSSISHVSCNGGADGVINITVSGGTSPYIYLWTGAVTTEDRTGVSAGLYSVSVTDMQGCTVTAGPYLVSEPTAVTVSLSALTHIQCTGNSTGAIDIFYGGGTSPWTVLWSDGSTQGDRNAIPAGIYTITVTDSKACTGSSTYVLTQPASGLAISGSLVTNVICTGQSNGAIDVIISGGTTPYAYLWADGGTIEDRVSVPAGNHGLTVTDNSGCTATTAILITQPSALSLFISSLIHVSCNGANDGAVTINVAGGSTPYVYSWSSGSTVNSASLLTAGTWGVSVVDAMGCITTSSYLITEPATAVALSATVTNILCYGNNNGAIDLSVTGGTPAYTYSWSSGSTSQDISAVSGGLYSVTVTDNSGCSASSSYVITEPASGLSLINPTITNALCNGSADGSVDVFISGGSTPYTFSWSNGATTMPAVTLAAGSYTVTVTDAGLCSATGTYSVSEPPALTLDMIVVHVGCAGSSTGSIDARVLGGTAPYTFLWSHGPTTEDVFSLSAVSYMLTATDANGCAITGLRTVTEPAALAVSALITHVGCAGSPTGTIALSTTGGITPYLYAWSNGHSAAVNSGLAASAYSVTVADNNGCSLSGNYFVTEPASGFILSSSSVTHVSCNGSSDASIDITLSGGTLPYTVIWSNGATIEDIASLSAGVYIVTATDNAGCSLSETRTVTQPAGMTLSAVPTDVLCNGDATGALNLSVAGGSAPYIYNWSNGQSVEDIGTLIAGIYSVTVVDFNGCVSTDNYIVNQPPAMSITATVSHVTFPGGNDGSVVVLAAGGSAPYTYAWNNGVTTVNNTGLIQGTYSVTVTDANLCTISGSYLITEPAGLTVTLTATHILCNGAATGAVNTTITGGIAPLTFSWNSGQTSQNIAGLIAGTYTIIVTDNVGTKDTASVMVTEPSAIVVSLDGLSQISCNGSADGIIDISASGGTGALSFMWSNSAVTEDIFALAAGTYTATVTDGSGCTAIVSYSLSEPAILQQSGTIQHVSCTGGTDGSVDITVTGGTPVYSFIWSNSSVAEDISSLVAAVYSVTVTDSRGCSAGGSYIITEGSSSTVNLIVLPSMAACSGQIITLNAGPGYAAYLWSTGDVTQTTDVTLTGIYTVTATTAGGCNIYDTVNITFHALPVVALGADYNSCTGNTEVIDAGAGFVSYLWSTSAVTQQISVTATGTYAVTVTDANNCKNSDDIVVNFIPSPVVMLGGDTSVCDGQSVILDAGPGFVSYLWSGGQMTQSITVNVTGTYSVTVTIGGGCTGTGQRNVTVETITPGFSYSTACEDRVTAFTDTSIVSGGTVAQRWWDYGAGNTSASSFTFDTTGTFNVQVIVQTNTNCFDSIALPVVVHPLPVPALTFVPACDRITLNGSATVSSGMVMGYRWITNTAVFLTGQNTVYYISDGGEATAVTLYAMSDQGCEGEFTAPVSSLPKPVAAFSLQETNIGVGLPVHVVDESQGAVEWSYDFGDEFGASVKQNPSYTYSNGGKFVILQTVRSSAGCEDTATMKISVNSGVVVPTAFSPNGDNQNDVLYIIGGPFKEMNINIYNKWGTLLFTSKSQDTGWDGKFNGDDQPAGVYVYVLTGVTFDGTSVNLGGNVTLVR